jgi:hypothetical protein
MKLSKRNRAVREISALLWSGITRKAKTDIGKIIGSICIYGSET